MKISILGASAGVGLDTVKQALKEGHQVTALSRTTDTIPDDPNLKKIAGSATNIADLKKAIAGADAVIVTLGTGASTKATTLYTDAAKAILQALKEANAAMPLIVLTGFGAGESGQYQSFFMKIIFSLMLKKVYANKTDMERMITAGYKNWEIVRPGRLLDKPMTGQYKVLESLTKGMSIGSIARADVAHFLVSQAEKTTLIGKYPALTY